MAFITARGVLVRAFQEIYDILGAHWHRLTGKRLRDNKPEGQFMRVIAEVLSNKGFPEQDVDALWPALQDVFYSAYIPTATAISLDYLGAWLGLPRLADEKATGAVAFSGPSGTVIPAGTVVATNDGASYVTTENVTIGPMGVSDVLVRASEPGPRFNKASGTITIVESTANVTVSNARATHTYVLHGNSPVWQAIPNEDSTSYYQVIHTNNLKYLTDVDSFIFPIRATDAGAYWLHIELWSDAVPNLVARSQSKRIVLNAQEETVVEFDSQLMNITSLRGQKVRVVIVNERKSPAALEVQLAQAASTDEAFYANGVAQTKSMELQIVTKLVGEIRGGRSLESDNEYRMRLARAIFRPARATPGAIISRLQEVLDLRHVTFDENVFLDDTYSRLPAKSVGLVIAGGFVPEIAKALAETVPAGILSTGSDFYYYPVTDTFVRPVGFFRPRNIPISVRAVLKRTGVFDDEKVRLFKDAIVEYIGGEDSQGTLRVGLRPGQEVVLAELYDRVMEIDGVYDVKLSLARDGLYREGNVPIDIYEIAYTNPTLITVD